MFGTSGTYTAEGINALCEALKGKSSLTSLKYADKLEPLNPCMLTAYDASHLRPSTAVQPRGQQAWSGGLQGGRGCARQDPNHVSEVRQPSRTLPSA